MHPPASSWHIGARLTPDATSTFAPRPGPRGLFSSPYASRTIALSTVGRLITFPCTFNPLDTFATLDHTANQMGGLQPTLDTLLFALITQIDSVDNCWTPANLQYDRPHR